MSFFGSKTWWTFPRKQLYAALSGVYTLSGGLQLPKAEAQAMTQLLALKRAEADDLKELYKALEMSPVLWNMVGSCGIHGVEALEQCYVAVVGVMNELCSWNIGAGFNVYYLVGVCLFF